jgi:DNA adenine methylase
MGTGVVAFNIRPQNAILCDSNPHLINFYKAIQKKEISSVLVKNHLSREGEKLLSSNGDYYYEVRKRFNDTANPLDFLFLSRACFNGMMRFNKKGARSSPEGHSPTTCLYRHTAVCLRCIDTRPCVSAV